MSKSEGKKNPVKAFFKFIGIFILSLIVLLFIWILYSSLDRKKSLDYIPEGFSTLASIDNLYKAANPLLDLKAVDLYLSSEKNLSEFLPFLYTARKSPLRKNPFIAFLLKRKVQASLYTESLENADFCLVMDLGWLSAFTRPFPLISNFINIRGLSSEKNEGFTTFILNPESSDDVVTLVEENEEQGAQTIEEIDESEKSPENLLYFVLKKNLIILSQNKELINKAFAPENSSNNFSNKVAELSKSDSNPLKIFLNTSQLIMDLKNQNQEQALYEILEKIVSKDQLSLLTLDIKDSSLALQAILPTDSSIEEKEYQNLMELLKTDVQVPSVISRLSSSVQYYTIINALPFEKLKDALFPILPDGKKYQDLWKNASDLTKSLLNNSLDNLLFSWTGDEICLFGMEGITSPVFALEIKDEELRNQVFENLSSSFIMRDDTSLILNGVRLPRLVFPDYIQNLLKAFGKNIKGLYYIVSDGFIYFSESPEPLAGVFNSSLSDRISKNMNWKSLQPSSNASVLSLFYDLERSIPFFLKQKSIVSDILSLYSIGRFDLQLSQGVFKLSLNSTGKRYSMRSSLPLFPMELEGQASGNLISLNENSLSGQGKEKKLYWVENSKIIKGYDIQSGKTFSFECSGETEITGGTNGKQKNLWAITKNAEIYLFDEDLNVRENFPVYLDYKASAPVQGCQDGLIVALSNGNLAFVSFDGSIEEVQLNLTGQIKSRPFVNGKTILVYEKGFLGKIHKIEGKNYISDFELSLPGVAYGSPVLFRKGKSEYISMITQNGNLFLWENGEVKSGFPLKLPGVFFSNVVYNGNYIFAISDSAELFRVSTDGAFMAVKIPDASCKEGFLTAQKIMQKGDVNIFVSLDGNSLYGFNEKLELLPFFPVPGWKNPVFTDLNGDSKADILLLTADDKLAAWNIQ